MKPASAITSHPCASRTAASDTSSAAPPALSADFSTAVSSPSSRAPPPDPPVEGTLHLAGLDPPRLLPPVAPRVALPVAPPEPGPQAFRQHRRDVVGQAPACDVGERVHRHGTYEREQSLHVDPRRREQPVEELASGERGRGRGARDRKSVVRERV